MWVMANKPLATIVPLPAPDADYRVLVEVLQELSRGVDLPSTFQAAARGLSRLTRFDWMCISWCPPRGRDVFLHLSLSGRPDWLATSQELPGLSPKVTSWFLPDMPRIVQDATHSPAADEPDWPVPYDIGPLVTVPMPTSGGGSRASGDREQRRGALVLGRSRSVPFEPGLVGLLEPCAAHLAVLLEKAEWLERFRATNAELREQVQRLKSARTPVLADTPTIRSAAVPLRSDPGAGPRWLAVDRPGLEALELVERAASTGVSVLLHGDSGTGKELMAQTLHRLSDRGRGPFVAVNVASLTSELVSSELFGHVPGAFTGARGERRGLIEDAAGGTLFLDEIGDMPPAVQPALLRFLEDGLVRPVGGNRSRTVDTRVVCATHRDLLADVVSGRFREDLYHRLAGITVYLPPLRERPGDMRMLARAFLKEYSDGRYHDLPPEWWPALRGYHWPGNVRELRNAMRSVAAMSRGPELEARFLPMPLRDLATGGAIVARADDPFDGWTLTEVEREMIRRALKATGGHRGQAAQRLGITPRSLYDKVRRLGLE
jgi:DNA-binding NtrC family response regulator